MIHLLSEFFAFLFVILTFKKLDNFSRLIALQVCIAFIVEFIGWQMTKKNQKNGWLYNLYMPVEFSLLFLPAILSYKPLLRYGMSLLFACYWVCWGVEIFHNSIENFAVKTYVLGAVILLVIYLAVLFRLAWGRKSIFRQSQFWIGIGIILFFGCSIPFFSMYDYIVTNSNEFQKNLLTNLMKVFYHFRYICTAIGFLIVFQEVKKKEKAIRYGE